MSAACLSMPTAAHVAAGGGAPVDAGFLLVAALLGAACVALADRRRSVLEIGALLLLSQPVFHVVLTLAGHHGTTTVVPSGSMIAAHLVAAAVLTVVLAGAESVVWSMAALSATVLLRRVRALTEPPVAPQVDAGRVRHPFAPESSFAAYVADTAPRRGPPVPSFS